VFGKLSALFTASNYGRNVKRAPPKVTKPTYAVGDIHGRDDLLGQLLDLISADADQNTLDEFRLVFMGDYIDRGEHSREVVDRLRLLQNSVAADTICLKGNHEIMLLEF
jgi:serine/threonine protein phosphatase 1